MAKSKQPVKPEQDSAPPEQTIAKMRAEKCQRVKAEITELLEQNQCTIGCEMLLSQYRGGPHWSWDVVSTE